MTSVRIAHIVDSSAVTFDRSSVRKALHGSHINCCAILRSRLLLTCFAMENATSHKVLNRMRVFMAKELDSENLRGLATESP